MVSGVGSTDLKRRASPLSARKAGDKATNGSVRASISLLFDLAIQELSLPAPFVPSPDEMVFRGIKARPTCSVNPCSFWWLLHLQIVVDPLPGETHLARNGGHVHLFGGQIMDVVRAFHTLLMVLLALLLLAFALAGMPRKNGYSFLCTGGGCFLDLRCCFQLRLFSQEEALHRLGKVL